MPKGSRLLKNWRATRGLTQTAAAQLVPASTAGWCDWESGGIPKLKVAFRIEEITDGEVPVASWNESEEEEATGGAAA